MTSTKRAVKFMLIGRKYGMTQVWSEDNKVVPVTVVNVGNNIVTQIKTRKKDGYDAIQLGFEENKEEKVTNPLKGHFSSAGITAKKVLREQRIEDPGTFELGQSITVDIFSAGDEVDVVANTKGKGFSGVMKRHGFSGGPAGHGAHKIHRKPGSIGACATPGRIFKGRRMAGRYGNTRSTIQNLKIERVDSEKGLLFIKGSVPGPNNCIVTVKSACKGSK